MSNSSRKMFGTCTTCDGDGFVGKIENDCSTCHGTGEMFLGYEDEDYGYHQAKIPRRLRPRPVALAA